MKINVAAVGLAHPFEVGYDQAPALLNQTAEQLAGHRSQCRTADAHGRDPGDAEDQHPVQQDVQKIAAGTSDPVGGCAQIDGGKCRQRTRRQADYRHLCRLCRCLWSGIDRCPEGRGRQALCPARPGKQSPARCTEASFPFGPGNLFVS